MVDAAALLSRVGFGQQPPQRHLDIIGIAAVLDAIGHAQLYRLHEQMQRPGILVDQFIRAEALHQVEGFQDLEGGGIGRVGENLVIAVAGADGLHPLRLVGGQIRSAEQPIHAADPLDELLGQRPPVEGLRAVPGDGAERGGQLRHGQTRARPRRLALLIQQHRGGRGKGAQPRRTALHDLAAQVGHGKTVLGIADGRGEELLALHAAIGFVQFQPAGDVAGHQRSQDARLFGCIRKAFRVGCLRRPARKIQRPHPVLSGDIYQCYANAANTGHIGFDDIQRCGCRHRRIKGIAARRQNAHAGRRGQRMRRGHHAVDAHGHGPAGRWIIFPVCHFLPSIFIFIDQ